MGHYSVICVSSLFSSACYNTSLIITSTTQIDLMPNWFCSTLVFACRERVLSKSILPPLSVGVFAKRKEFAHWE